MDRVERYRTFIKQLFAQPATYKPAAREKIGDLPYTVSLLTRQPAPGDPWISQAPSRLHQDIA